MNTNTALPHTHASSVPTAAVPLRSLTDSAACSRAAVPSGQHGNLSFHTRRAAGVSVGAVLVPAPSDALHVIARHAVAMRIALCAQDAANVPEWIELIPAGIFGGRDGRGPYVLDAEAVIAAFLAGGIELPIDYEHQTLEAAERKGPVPAAGWIEHLEVRDGALWARVSWTPRAAELIAAREYRFISPVFRHDETGRIIRLEGAGLTHYPNLDLAPVAHAMGAHLGETAMTDQAPEQCTEPQTVEAHAQDASGAGAVSTGTAAPAEETVAMSQHKAVCDELAELKAQIAQEAADAAVRAAMSEGKVTPAMKDWASAYARADPEGFRAYCGLVPAVVTADEIAQHVNQNHSKAATLTDEDRQACALLGLDEGGFAAHKAALNP